MIHLDLHLLRGCTMRATALLLCLAFFAVLFSGGGVSEGAVISRDWKTPGDGLLTYDDVNNREWLDLTETQLFKFPGDTLEERYQAILNQTTPGGRFASFVVASSPNEIRLLGDSAGIDTSTLTNPMNPSSAGSLIYQLGATVIGNGPESVGMLDGIDGRTGDRGKMRVLNDGSSAGMLFGLGLDSRAGVWLYREVPEPPGRLLLGVVFVAAIIYRYRVYRSEVR